MGPPGPRARHGSTLPSDEPSGPERRPGRGRTHPPGGRRSGGHPSRFRGRSAQRGRQSRSATGPLLPAGLRPSGHHPCGGRPRIHHHPAVAAHTPPKAPRPQVPRPQDRRLQGSQGSRAAGQGAGPQVHAGTRPCQPSSVSGVGRVVWGVSARTRCGLGGLGRVGWVSRAGVGLLLWGVSAWLSERRGLAPRSLRQRDHQHRAGKAVAVMGANHPVTAFRSCPQPPPPATPSSPERRSARPSDARLGDAGIPTPGMAP